MFYNHKNHTEATTQHKIGKVKTLLNLLHYILLRIFLSFFSLFGYKIGVQTVRFLFLILGKIPALRQRALDQLLIAYPNSPREKLKEIATKAWVNLGNVAMDFSWLPALKNRDDFYEFENLEAFKTLYRTHKNIVFFSGHNATWEIFRLAAFKEGYEIGMIYRAFNNHFFDSYARHLMTYDEVPIFQKGSKGIKKMMGYIMKGGSVLILVDQYLGGGVKTKFMGVETNTAPSAVDIALKYNMPLVPVFVRRNGIGKFIISVKNPLTTSQEGAEKKMDMINKMNSVLEEHIHAYPDEWFWHHRRWKRK